MSAGRGCVTWEIVPSYQRLNIEMDQQSQETSEVLTFAPRQRMRNESDAIDDVGYTLVAMLKEAATLS